VKAPWTAWLDLSLDTARLGCDASQVIGLRMALAAAGGPGAPAEFARMVNEKAQTAIDAHILLTRSVLDGEAHLAPARTVALYRERVESNCRRLTKVA
jgi:hypothetical protein